MSKDLYSFVFRGQLAEEALDKAGRKKYSTEEAFFSEELAKKLHFDEIDSKYVEQSKTMLTVFATITAFENATREFVYSVLFEKHKNDWWSKGVQKSVREILMIFDLLSVRRVLVLIRAVRGYAPPRYKVSPYS